MKRSIITVAFFIAFGVITLFSQSGPGTGQIILPDPEITIEDKSKIDFIESGDTSLTDMGMNLTGIDLEELATSRISEKIQSLLLPDFDGNTNKALSLNSLSYFRLFYGRYDNLLIDFNLGKSAGVMNYLITYLRNKRGGAGIGSDTYFNTEMTIDDLNAGFLFSISDKLDLNLNMGYYERVNGLYLNPFFLQESKLSVPVKAELVYHIDMVSRLKMQIFYQGLWLAHKSLTNSLGSIFSEAGINLFFQSNYSKDNYFKLTAEYFMFSQETNRKHQFAFSGLDRFPIIKGISLEVGAHLFVYSEKPVFWYPDASINIQISNFMSISGGITGKQDAFAINEIIANNQLDYTNVTPLERWTYFGMIDIFPFKASKLNLTASYHTYGNFMSWVYSGARDLYFPAILTNIQMGELKASYEMLITENLMLNISYTYFLTSSTNLLLWSRDTGSISINLTVPAWGFVAQTKAAYRSEMLVIPGVTIPYTVTWDLQLSQAINKEIYLQLDLKNLLNMAGYEKIHIPNSGFSYNFGVKILL
ncbi:MAG: hypothetical protein HPY53_01785 [Brevinematales bacterium]|nr:hypothetical protein [Brevinematales bacterium]